MRSVFYFFHLLICVAGWAAAVGLWGYGLWLYRGASKPLGGMGSAIVMIVLAAGFLCALILALPSTLAAGGARRDWRWAFWLILLRDGLLAVALAAATVRNLLPGEAGAGAEFQTAVVFGTLAIVFLVGIFLDIVRIYVRPVGSLEGQSEPE